MRTARTLRIKSSETPAAILPTNTVVAGEPSVGFVGLEGVDVMTVDAPGAGADDGDGEGEDEGGTTFGIRVGLVICIGTGIGTGTGICMGPGAPMGCVERIGGRMMWDCGAIG